jgi:hypothetical protein
MTGGGIGRCSSALLAGATGGVLKLEPRLHAPLTDIRTQVSGDAVLVPPWRRQFSRLVLCALG